MDSLSFYEHAPLPHPLSIISVPTELGSEAHGLKDTPDFLRRHGLSEILRHVGVEVADEIEIACDALDDTTDATAQAVANAPGISLVLGGDHSAALGSMRGASQKHSSMGVIYIDAHPDVHTPETTLTGNAHGMVAASAMEHVGPENFLFVGLKDFDQAEIEFIREHKPPHFTMLDIAERGLGPVTQAINSLSQRVERVWVSFDIDSIDRTFAPGVAMPNDAGLSAREALLLAQYIGSSVELAGLDIVEMLPANDIDNKTAKLALSLIARLLGGEWGDYQQYMRGYTERSGAIVRL
jgi:arginase